MATIDKNNFPNASYAPVINHNNKTYIYLSSMALHYENILSNLDKISILYIEDISNSKTPALRKQLTYNAKARAIPRQSKIFNEVISQFKNSEDKSLKTIAIFIDFTLFEITIGYGRFVKEFGQAYTITQSGEICHIDGGSQSSKNPHAK